MLLWTVTEMNGFDVVRGGTGGGVFLYATRHDEPADEGEGKVKVRPLTLKGPSWTKACLTWPSSDPSQSTVKQESEFHTVMTNTGTQGLSTLLQGPV